MELPIAFFVVFTTGLGGLVWWALARFDAPSSSRAATARRVSMVVQVTPLSPACLGSVGLSADFYCQPPDCVGHCAALMRLWNVLRRELASSRQQGRCVRCTGSRRVRRPSAFLI